MLLIIGIIFAHLVIVLVTVPLHEIFHLATMRLFGVWPDKPDIKLICIPESLSSPVGYIHSKNGIWTGPEVSEGALRMIVFIIGLSGGLGVFLFCSLLFAFVYIFLSKLYWVMIGAPLLINGITQLIYGFYEAFFLCYTVCRHI